MGFCRTSEILASCITGYGSVRIVAVNLVKLTPVCRGGSSRIPLVVNRLFSFQWTDFRIDPPPRSGHIEGDGRRKTGAGKTGPSGARQWNESR